MLSSIAKSTDKPRKFRSRWDKLGIALSGLCLVHCLALPVVTAALPVIGVGASHNHVFHVLILLLVVPTIAMALKKAGRDFRIYALLASGFVLITTGLAGAHFIESQTFEFGFTVAGSIMLVAGHWSNHRRHDSCKNPKGLS
mgnify:CR=1 FL=1